MTAYFAAVYSSEKEDDEAAEGDVDQVAALVVTEVPRHHAPLRLLLLEVHGSTSEVTGGLKLWTLLFDFKIEVLSVEERR